jgi:hypothetical protein
MSFAGTDEQLGLARRSSSEHDQWMAVVTWVA